MNKSKHKSKPKAKKWKKKIFFYLALALCLFAVAYSVYLVISAPLEIKTLDVKFIVGQNAGFDLNKSILTFGRIIPGGSAVREVNIENNYNFSILIKAYASNNIAEYIDIEQEYLKINASGKKKIPVTVSLPVNISFGEYSGRLVFKIYKAKQ
jgi:hypothetical protein